MTTGTGKAQVPGSQQDSNPNAKVLESYTNGAKHTNPLILGGDESINSKANSSSRSMPNWKKVRPTATTAEEVIFNKPCIIGPIIVDAGATTGNLQFRDASVAGTSNVLPLVAGSTTNVLEGIRCDNGLTIDAVTTSVGVTVCYWPIEELDFNVISARSPLARADATGRKYPARYGRSVIATSFSNIEDWTSFTLNGGSIVDNSDRTATLTTVGATERAYKTISLPSGMVAGEYYMISVGLSAITGDFSSTPNFIALSGITNALGDSNLTAMDAGVTNGDRVGFVFEYTSDVSGELRIGLNPFGGAAANCSVTLDRPVVQKVNGADAVVAGDGYIRSGMRVAYASSSTKTFSQGLEGGIIQENGNTASSFNTRSNVFGLCVGDSYGNDDTDYPRVMLDTYEDIGLVYNCTSGAKLAAINTNLQALFNDPSNYYDNSNAVAPQYVIVQGGINDIIAFSSRTDASVITDLQAELVSMHDTIITNGATPIYVGLAPISSYVSFDVTAGMQAYIEAYNEWLRQYAFSKGVPFLSLYDLLGDPADSTQMLAAYSSDGLHPDQGGSPQLIADELAYLIYGLDSETR